MPEKGILWRGKYYNIPQAASFIDSSALAKSPLGGANNVAILGEMIGLLTPKVPTLVGNPSQARELINPLSGDARLAARLVFDPSPGSDTPGASQVYLLPVNPATPATLDLGTLDLTSYMFGRPANQIKAKVENGTSVGKKLTVAFKDNIEAFDDITSPAFSIHYTGAGDTARITIDISAAVHTMTLEVTGAEDGMVLDLHDFDSLQAIVDAISVNAAYTVTMLADATEASPMLLDAAVAQDIKGATFTATSDLQAVVDKLNSMSTYVSAARKPDAGAPPADINWTYLSGGENGSTTNNDWQEAFDALKTIKADLIVILSDDPSIHAMGDSHCTWMSGPNGKKERRQFVGGALQNWNSPMQRTAAIAALKAAAKVLNSDRTMHVGLGTYQYDENGKQKLYPAYITAAMYAGIAAGGRPRMPLTRKYLKCLGLEVDLQPTEASELIDAGVAPPYPDPVDGAGYVISRQVTTWNKDTDLYRVEFSVGRGADYTASEVRKRHERIAGEEGSEAEDVTIVNITNGVLQDQLTAGDIRSYDPKQTQLRADNLSRYVDYSAVPILPINWIFSTYHLQPTTATIQI